MKMLYQLLLALLPETYMVVDLIADVMTLHHKYESRSVENVFMMCTTKVYCHAGQVLFMGVSLHSMCHSLSPETRERC